MLLYAATHCHAPAYSAIPTTQVPRPPSTPSKRSLSYKSCTRQQKKLLSKTDSAIELVSEKEGSLIFLPVSKDQISSFEICLFSITIFFTRQLNLPSYSISCIKSKLFSLSTMSTMSNCLGTKATTRFLSETTFQQQRTAKNRKVLSSGESLHPVFFLPSFLLSFSLHA